MTNESIAITLDTISAALGLLGICLTVNAFLKEDPDNPGLFMVPSPKRWRRLLGPVTIGLGIVVEYLGDITAVLNALTS